MEIIRLRGWSPCCHTIGIYWSVWVPALRMVGRTWFWGRQHEPLEVTVSWWRSLLAGEKKKTLQYLYRFCGNSGVRKMWSNKLLNIQVLTNTPCSSSSSPGWTISKVSAERVMFCIMSADFTFLHWIRMAAVLLSVGLSWQRAVVLPAASFLTRQPLWQSSCWGIRMKLWKYFFYSIIVWTLLLSNSSSCMMPESHVLET